MAAASTEGASNQENGHGETGSTAPGNLAGTSTAHQARGAMLWRISSLRTPRE
jgi:hypothetical protein